MSDTMTNTRVTSFRQRLSSGAVTLGTFLKTPSPILCELLAASPLDAVCIDAEHAPFGRMELDSCLQVLRSAGMPSLVRLPTGAPEHVLNALDCGATGIVVPHVTSVAQAVGIIRSAHFGRGGRGYAGSTRAAGFTGKPMADHLRDSAASTTVVLQIEDVEALDCIEEIAAVPGVDCLFVGRIDLTMALGADSPQAPEVIDAVDRVCRAASEASVAIGMFVPAVEEAALWMQKGASLFLLDSDQGFVASGAAELRRRFDSA